MVAFVLITQFESENGAEAVVMKSPDDKRLIEVVHHHNTLNAGELLDEVIASVIEFTGNAQQKDDLTLVVMKRT